MSMIVTILDDDDNGVSTHRLSSTDEQLIVDALNRMRAENDNALLVANHGLPKGVRKFTERDFGIPRIDELIKIIEGE